MHLSFEERVKEVERRQKEVEKRKEEVERRRVEGLPTGDYVRTSFRKNEKGQVSEEEKF